MIEVLALRPLTMNLSQDVAKEIESQPIEVGTLGEKPPAGLLSGVRLTMQREIVGTIGTGQASPVYQFTLYRFKELSLCRARFHIPPTISSARYKTAPYKQQFFSVGSAFTLKHFTKIF
ncbi:MAG: hypothetical protein RMK18_10270 [Armatimonadota bacterium]|nr:hypothetical protein [Armatimonadota bacterium]MDW8026229.1 hypothetical protein [Armatimonadota bacterium]